VKFWFLPGKKGGQQVPFVIGVQLVSHGIVWPEILRTEVQTQITETSSGDRQGGSWWFFTGQ